MALRRPTDVNDGSYNIKNVTVPVTGAAVGINSAAAGQQSQNKQQNTQSQTNKTSTNTGTGNATANYVVTPSKSTNPYENPSELTRTNPYAGLAGKSGENPYSKLTAPGGENPYANVDRSGYTASPEVQSALDYLNSLRKQAPGEYNDPYSDQLNQLYQDIVGRGKFSYDLNGDMLYKQYQQQYQNMGQQAMRDTMGQAAALTGGYGSSYAATAGNQAYQNYLAQLNNIIPELYDRAYNVWQGEGDQMLQQYNMLRDLQNTDYSRYQDLLNQWYNNMNMAREDYANERNFDYGQWSDQWNRNMNILQNQAAWDQQNWENNLGLTDRQASWDQQQWENELNRLQLQTGWDQSEQERLQNLWMTMAQMGLNPSDAMGEGSGLSPYDRWQILQFYNKPTTTYVTGNTGNTGNSGSKSKATGDPAQLASLNTANGIVNALKGAQNKNQNNGISNLLTNPYTITPISTKDNTSQNIVQAQEAIRTWRELAKLWGQGK